MPKRQSASKRREKNSVFEVARGLLGEDRELAIGLGTMQAVRWVSMSGTNYCLDVSLQTESVSFTTVRSLPQRMCSANKLEWMNDWILK